MLIRQGYQYRLYPNQAQEQQLRVQFGHARYVYNHFRALRDESYEESGQGLSYETTTALLRKLKQEEDHRWLQAGDSQVLQQSLKDLGRAYENWFRMCREGKRPSNKGKPPRKDGKPRGYPRFKSRHGTQSIRYPQRFKLEGKRLYLPKVGWVKIVLHRPPVGKLKNCTVTRTKSGKFYVSLQCEQEQDDPQPRPGRVGIDLGLVDFVTTSEGEKVAAPRHLQRGERRLKKLQRRMSRKQPRSKNREKARQRLALAHERVAQQRRDFHHQLSRWLADRYGRIAIEDLNIQGMVRNGKLAKSISDAGWGQFVRFLRYKAEWTGGQILNVDRFFPSSQLCSECGEKHQALKLSERQWVCLSCGRLHDRDTNAAINILKATTAGAAGSPSEGRERYACGDTILKGESAQEAHALVGTAPAVLCGRG